MLYRFFLIEENKSLDILQIQEMDQIIKEFKIEELNKVTQNYKSIQGQNYKKFNIIKDMFSDLIKELIQLIKEQNIIKLNEINYKNKTVISKSHQDLLFKMGVPEENLTKIKNFL